MWTFRGALAIIGLVVAALLVSTFVHAGEPPDPPVPVSKGVGFNDEPAMARAADGSLYVAWNSFRGGADSLQVARFQTQGKDFKLLGAWQILGGKGTYILGVRAVSAGQNVSVLYAAERNKNWDIYAVPCGPEGPGQPVAVSSHAGVDVKPAAVWHDGILWVAWESNRTGLRQIFVASVCEDNVCEPVSVSRPENSCYCPSIAVLESGETCVAWHSFCENNYDIYLRRKAADGRWGPQMRLTRAASVDRHAVLLTRGDQLWLVYENAQTGGADYGDQSGRYRFGLTGHRRLIVAKVTPKGLLAPKDYRGNSPLYDRCEGPTARFDSSGRLWLALLKPHLPREGWDVYVACFTGSRWQQPTRVSARKGMDRSPSLVLDGNRAIVAFQADDIPNVWSGVDQTSGTTSDIFLTALDLGSTPKAEAMRLEPLAEPDESFEPGQIRVTRGEDARGPAITYKGQTLKLFYGNLHAHSDVSVCKRLSDQSIDEDYQHMRDIAGLDFGCTTDHGFNINPYLWHYTGKLVRINEDRGRFLTFLAQEWTSNFKRFNTKHPYGYYGHRNLILADPYFPRWWNGWSARNGKKTPARLWKQLRKLNANFVLIPHQLADTSCVPTDWDFIDEQAQPVAEIFQLRGSYEYKGCPREAVKATPKPGYFIQDAWARGVIIGVIASPDHGGGHGKACVYAPGLTREAILDALRARHCYGTTAAKIFLDVRVNGHLMGEKVAAPAAGSVEVEVRARCPAEIDRIEVCRNNRFIYTNNPKGREAEITFIDREPLRGYSYYYIRLVQKDQEIAWSSPVWFGVQ